MGEEASGGMGRTGFCSQSELGSHTLTLPVTSCVTLGESLTLRESLCMASGI